MGTRLAFVGAGRLTRSLGGALVAAGHRVEVVAARRAGAARSAARALGAPRATTRTALALDAEVIVLGVPDSAIAGVAAALARAGDRIPWRRRVVLHAAGALGPEPLAVLAAAGASTGVLHPLQVLDGRPDPAGLRGCAARIEGGARATRVAARLARDCGMEPLRLAGHAAAAERLAYHAAASLAANDVVALLSWAIRLFGEAGVPPRRARRALAALCRGAADRLADGGLSAALTGPVVRGDAATLIGHLRRLDSLDTRTGAAHRLLSAQLLELEHEVVGRLDPGRRRRVKTALRPPAGRSRTPTV